MADVLVPALQLFEVKDLLNIQGGTDDAKLIRMILSVSDFAEKQLNRTLGERTAITELLGTARRTSTRRFWTKRAPITDTTTFDLRIDGARVFGSDTQLTLTDDYIIEKALGYAELLGDRFFTGFRFGTGPQTVQITYSAGYSVDAMPPDIKEALIALIEFLRTRKATSAIALTSKSIAGGTEGYSGELPEVWENMLTRYKRRTFAPGF